MARLGLTLLGVFQVGLDGTPITSFSSNKVRALLAYLAVEADRSHSREALATLLWPEFPAQAAMNYLRAALYELRHTVGDSQASQPYLLVTHGSVQWNTGSDYWLDVKEFEHLANSSQVESFERAVDLYKNSFLEGFSVGGSTPFEEWASLQREKFHRMMMRMLHQLADFYLQCGEYVRGERYARRQVELEPWYEEAHRQLMLALALEDQRGAALVQFDTCCRMLEDELGVEPTNETRRLYEAIRDAQLEEQGYIGELKPVPGVPPYKGLLFFDIEDTDLFFGREVLTAKLVEHVREMMDARNKVNLLPFLTHLDKSENFALLAVVGASGSGKSSVVRAGLVPLVQHSYPEWKIQVMTPTAHPLRELQHFPASHGVKGSSGSQTVLLVIDQFEEVFTLCREESERAEFINCLLDACQFSPPETRLTPGRVGNEKKKSLVVIVLRADFYAHCARYPRLRHALCARQEYIGSMDADELRRAIEQPARRNGWTFEPGLVDLFLRDVGSHAADTPEPGALPLLSHALLETWKRRRGRELTHAGYAEAGGVHGAIARTAQSIFDSLSASQQVMARRTFLRLTELGEGTQDTRRRVRLEELVGKLGEASVAEDLLQLLADARLITLSKDTAEVAHEALIHEWPMLHEWLREDREGLLLHRRLTEAAQVWQDLDRDPSELYRGARLSQALEWVKREGHSEELNPLEQAFLQISQAEAEREQLEREAHLRDELEATRRLLEAERQRTVAMNTALAHELAVQAKLKLDTDPELSLLIALEAVEGLKSTELPAPWDVQQVLHDILTTSRLLKTIQLSHLPWSVIYSPDGNRIAFLDDAYITHFIEVESCRELFTLPDTKGGFAFSPDGKFFAAGTFNQNVVLWDTKTGRPCLTLADIPRDVWGIAFSSDGNLIATGNEINDNAPVWDLAPWRAAGCPPGMVLTHPMQILGRWGMGFPEGEGGGFHGIEFSPDGTQVATIWQNTVKIWEVASGRELHTLSGHRYFLMDLSFHPEGKILASGDNETTVRIWDTATGHELRSITDSSGVYSLAFSRDGNYLVTAGRNGKTMVWESNNWRCLITLPGLGAVNDMSIRPDGKQIITTHEDRVIRIWDSTRTGRGELITLQYVRKIIFAIPSIDGSLFAIVDQDGGVKIFESTNLSSFQELSDTCAVTKESDANRILAFSYDDLLLAVTCDDILQVWDISDAQKVCELQTPGVILSVAFSPDRKWLATGGRFGSVMVWELAESKKAGETYLQLIASLRWTLPVTIDYVQMLSFNPNRASLAAGGYILSDRGGGLVFIWDIDEDLDQVPQPFTFMGDYRKTHFIEFSPDGKYLVTAGDDEHAEVWDVTVGRCIRQLTGHNANIFEIHYSRDGSYLVTTSFDGTSKTWDASNGKELLSFKLPAPIISAFFTPDGSRIVLITNQGGLYQNAFLDFEELVEIAKSRRTRELRLEEKQKYLHQFP